RLHSRRRRRVFVCFVRAPPSRPLRAFTGPSPDRFHFGKKVVERFSPVFRIKLAATAFAAACRNAIFSKLSRARSSSERRPLGLLRTRYTIRSTDTSVPSPLLFAGRPRLPRTGAGGRAATALARGPEARVLPAALLRISSRDEARTASRTPWAKVSARWR